jgi:hypothetical protein
MGVLVDAQKLIILDDLQKLFNENDLHQKLSGIPTIIKKINI